MASKMFNALTITNGAVPISSSVVKSHKAHTHTVTHTYTTASGNISALTVDLYGSFDGTNFFLVDSHAFSGGELSAKTATIFLTGKLVSYVKLVISTLTENGATVIKLTSLYEGSSSTQ